MRNKSSGFTLIELLVVLVLGIVCFLIPPAVVVVVVLLKYKGIRETNERLLEKMDILEKQIEGLKGNEGGISPPRESP
jgi:prepilin-type N-terminal cleavage/methylation domain-containing protein|tara:strand:+ start:362 stop:595 length:234 start_codon:yes stop_codon:yes gene_type:complete